MSALRASSRVQGAEDHEPGAGQRGDEAEGDEAAVGGNDAVPCGPSSGRSAAALRRQQIGDHGTTRRPVERPAEGALERHQQAHLIELCGKGEADELHSSADRSGDAHPASPHTVGERAVTAADLTGRGFLHTVNV